ncbi:LytTR family DNA-binding domain-containing protein [Arenimonas sp. MALMAid1274]|uniref:LytTR family DNA-binding domain-containing protein n=1 Tax=Arenimonas sp. MALMAid1274 TaxID=3411630 RepID=UPI003B9F32E5
MSEAPTPFAERYLPHRRWIEIGFWVISTCLAAAGNTITVGMEMRRAGLVHHPLEPALWEWSSALLMLVLIPAVVWFTRRYPLHLDTWRRWLPLYVLASLAYCLVHVVGMVLVRKAAYQLAGEYYDFGPWVRQFFYEYVKDVRTFLGMVVLIEGYRLLVRRMQGEASLLAAPDDDAPPVEPIDRPERFLVRKLGREFLVAAHDIESLQAAGNYVNLRVRGRDYPLRSTIAAIEARLDPARFQRVHRSHIVNLDHVASIEPLDTGDARLHLRDGSTLPCSRRYRSALRDRAAPPTP